MYAVSTYGTQEVAGKYHLLVISAYKVVVSCPVSTRYVFGKYLVSYLVSTQ